MSLWVYLHIHFSPGLDLWKIYHSVAAWSRSKVFRQRRLCSGSPVSLKRTDAASSKQNTAEICRRETSRFPPRPGGSMCVHFATMPADHLLSSVYVTVDQTASKLGWKTSNRRRDKVTMMVSQQLYSRIVVEVFFFFKPPS